LPAIWGVLRDWPMQQHRAVMVLYNCTCHCALPRRLDHGDHTVARIGTAALPAACSWLGVSAWVRISPQRFRTLILLFLLASGVTLVSRGLWRTLSG